VDRIQVDKKFFGGYLDISEQAQSFSEPSMVERVLADMANVYALTTETYALQTMYNAISTIGYTRKRLDRRRRSYRGSLRHRRPN
jgi:hypothetical protein